MSTHRHINAICLIVLVFTLVITVLFMNGEKLGIRTITEVEAEEDSDSPYFTANDRQMNWSTTGATQISLLGSKAVVNGGGAYAYDRDVIITSAGRYVITGTLDNGSVVVDTDSKSKVWIRLNGAEIRCSDNACIRVEQAEKVFLTLEEGSVNRLESSGIAEEALAAGVNGALFSRDDLTLNGTGTLEVRSAGVHGITSNDDLIITGGTISISAGDDGLHANDKLNIESAQLELDTGDDGVSLTGGESTLVIASGSIRTRSGDKGISAAGGILILDGNLDIEAATDGINATGLVRIEDGTVNIITADDGIHSDTAVEIAGGKLTIPTCYEGIEAGSIEVSGGEIDIRPLDDGMNANGKAESRILVSGGSITIVNETARDADGLDSNGDILVSGGSIRISMINSGKNKALDFGKENGGVMEINGGEVIAVCNLTPVTREDYRIGVPEKGRYEIVFSGDLPQYGGSGQSSTGVVTADKIPMHGFKQSVSLRLGGLSGMFLRRKPSRKKSEKTKQAN